MFSSYSISCWNWTNVQAKNNIREITNWFTSIYHIFNRLPLKWSLNKRFHPLQTEYYEFVIASPKFHLASFVQHFGDAPCGLQSIVQRHYIYARIVRFVFYFLENAVWYKHRLYMVLSPDIVVWILRGQKDFIFSCHLITLLVI